jgi:hypothetical protein
MMVTNDVIIEVIFHGLSLGFRTGIYVFFILWGIKSVMNIIKSV